ncbi:class I SAM-dependent methyltransferase [Marinobacter mangrovi]|uniref:class I SAM-dependent methyltransferase n=1 Tax=Marinobacter mangrovi TaxID=2803918 RepID=UPI0019347845|nr:class I SAM-dependent methyltransferase [Marinobacter mangrovi]
MMPEKLMAPTRCSVCHSEDLRLLEVVGEVPYWRCGRCEATLMAPEHWLDRDAEKRVYDLHDNNPEDEGYQRFLTKLADPILTLAPDEAHGLDFGCGPGPALAKMLAARGMEVSLYDPFYAPNPETLEQTYDFITCTEVVEHLQDPNTVFRQLDNLLKPGGWLGVMTCFQTDDARFANWHYRRDPTHIVFYRESTLRWLAESLGWELEVPAKDVALFRKPVAA